MKITIEVDCTPDEARSYMGLPDVKPLQAAVMSHVEQQMLRAADQFSPDSILKTWLSAMPQLPTQIQDVFSRMLGSVSPSNGGKP